MAVFIKRIVKHKYETEYKFFPVNDKARGSHGIREYRELDADNLDASILESISRTKRTIKDYARNNEFDYFVTLTFDPSKFNSSNLGAVYDLTRNFLRRLRYSHDLKGVQLKYLLVPELHADKQKIHLHGYIKGDLPLSVARTPNGSKIKYKGKQVYNILSWEYGFSEAVRIGNSVDDVLKCSSYITKYVTKDLINEFDQHRFWASRGLDAGIIIKDTKVVYDTIDDAINGEAPKIYNELSADALDTLKCFKNKKETYFVITTQDPIVDTSLYEIGIEKCRP